MPSRTAKADGGISIAIPPVPIIGPIDMLVHSAGISIVEHATEVTWETWQQTIDVNLHGTFHIVDGVKAEVAALATGVLAGVRLGDVEVGTVDRGESVCTCCQHDHVGALQSTE